jgi:4-diphosphocytidyl-2-C-methyl-D-erythritol kinase
MNGKISCNACAKVNLHLAVGLPDETGYHAIESVFARVGVFDSLDIEWADAPVFSVKVDGLGQYCEPGTDTMTKAALAWYRRSKVSLSLSVVCSKSIPAKAGLGGGSSDAAALLLALQAIAGDRALGRDDLLEVGLSVGSDVPFFLSGLSHALVTGKGECMEYLRVPGQEVLLVMPTGHSVSTAEAYRRLDRGRGESFFAVRHSLSFYESVFSRNCDSWGLDLYNDFSPYTGNDDFYRTLTSLSRSFDGYGNLSGSGACWFFAGKSGDDASGLRDRVEAVFGSEVHTWLVPLLS